MQTSTIGGGQFGTLQIGCTLHVDELAEPLSTYYILSLFVIAMNSTRSPPARWRHHAGDLLLRLSSNGRPGREELRKGPEATPRLPKLAIAIKKTNTAIMSRVGPSVSCLVGPSLAHRRLRANRDWEDASKLTFLQCSWVGEDLVSPRKSLYKSFRRLPQLRTVGYQLPLLRGPQNSLFRFPFSTLLEALQFATTPVLAFLTLLPQTLCLISASTSRCALPGQCGRTLHRRWCCNWQ